MMSALQIGPADVRLLHAASRALMPVPSKNARPRAARFPGQIGFQSEQGRAGDPAIANAMRTRESAVRRPSDDKAGVTIMTDLVRKAVAEFIGTFTLVFFAVGSAVFGFNVIGAAGVALAFGLTLLALAYAIGPTSGCHVNPAVTLGVLLRRGISLPEAGAYWGAQLLGGIAAGALLKLMTSDFGEVQDQTDALGANSWGTTVSGGGAFVFELLATCLLVLVVILVTGRAAAPGFAGLAIGLVLISIHLVGIPLTGTSVNPARSLGPALFEGGEALTQLWLFVLAPLLGGALAALLSPIFNLPANGQADHAPGSDPTGASVPS